LDLSENSTVLEEHLVRTTLWVECVDWEIWHLQSQMMKKFGEESVPKVMREGKALETLCLEVGVWE
jgi:hypothetical protein